VCGRWKWRWNWRWQSPHSARDERHAAGWSISLQRTPLHARLLMSASQVIVDPFSHTLRPCYFILCSSFINMLTIANQLILDLSTMTFLQLVIVSSSEPFRSFNFLYVSHKIYSLTADQTSFRRRLCEWHRLFTHWKIEVQPTLLLLLGGVGWVASKVPKGCTNAEVELLWA